MNRGEVENRLGELKRQRGDAALSGRKFDSSEITALEIELDALADADGARARREREAAEAERLKRIEILKVELAAHMRSYLDDTKEAEHAARAEAAALGRMLKTAAEMARLSHQITGKGVPIPLIASEMASRLACRHAAVMGTIPQHQHHFGPLEWPSSHYKANDDWHAAESTLIERHVEPIIGKEKANGKG